MYIYIYIMLYEYIYIYTRHIPKTLNSIQPKPYTLKGSHAQKTPTNLCTALLGHDAPDGEVRLCSRINISGRKDLVLRFREILAISSLGFWVRPGTWQERIVVLGNWALEAPGLVMMDLVQPCVRTFLLLSVQSIGTLQLVARLCNSKSRMVEKEVRQRNLLHVATTIVDRARSHTCCGWIMSEPESCCPLQELRGLPRI